MKEGESVGDRKKFEAAEYERIRGLFDGVDEKQLALVDGAIHEAARLRAELDSLHEIVKRTGLLHYDASNPNRQKELPVSRMLPKVRAGYTNVIFKLSKVLGAVVNEEDLGLDDYE